MKIFHKRYLVERTYKAELRTEEQSGKAENYRENLWNEIEIERKGLKDRNRHKYRINRSLQARLVYVFDT